MIAYDEHVSNRYQQLVDELVRNTYLVSPHIIEAFRATRRKNFLRPHHRMFEGIDSPLPIGCNQTISQPLVVAFMVQMLNPQPGNRILDIGYGSGWQTAVLTRIAANTSNTSNMGDVYAYEIISEIADFGKKNIQKDLAPQMLRHIHLYETDYADSFENNAPYDRIIAGAAFDKTPETLIEALTDDGIIVYPTNQHDIRKITRTSKKRFTEEIFPGFVFVPITHQPR